MADVTTDFMGLPFDEVTCDCGTQFFAMQIDDELNSCPKCMNGDDDVEE